MMNRREFIPLTASALMLSACALPTKFKAYKGPQVTRVIVEKSTRSMWLMNESKVLKKYEVDLGFAPDGHKEIEGDGRTPEGSYFIDRRNPNSIYYLSLGISYPNTKDIAYAKSIGESPGGAIFIHGGPILRADHNKPDWTAGCISVTNKEMKVIYTMVQNTTQIDILP